MRSVLASIFLFFSVAIAAPAQEAKYIGLEYKGVVPDTVLPNGVKHLGGALISDYKVNPVHAISQVSKGQTQMLWLEVSTGKNEMGVTGWKVLDVISFPALTGAGHVMIPLDPAVECLRGGEVVPNLIALGRIDRRRGSFTAKRAWIADLTKKKFTPASVRGLRCTYSEP